MRSRVLRKRAGHEIASALLRRTGLFDRSYRLHYAGSTFTVPIVNGRQLKPSEPWMIDVLRRLFALKGAGQFVDVGVNLGQTLLKVAAIDPGRPYVGFEPNPVCVDYVTRLMQANGLGGTLIPAGLSTEASVCTLSLYGSETDPSATIVPNFRTTEIARRRSVVVIPWAALPSEVTQTPVAVVKIDVEGAELEVLQTLANVLRAQRPAIAVEVLPSYSADNCPRIERAAAIEALMTAMDYRMFRILRTADGRFSGFEPIDTMGIHGDLAMTDYVFLPREDGDRLETGASA